MIQIQVQHLKAVLHKWTDHGLWFYATCIREHCPIKNFALVGNWYALFGMCNKENYLGFKFATKYQIIKDIMKVVTFNTPIEYQY